MPAFHTGVGLRFGYSTWDPALPCGLRQQWRWPRYLRPCTHRELQKRLLDPSRLHISSVQAILAFWGGNQQIEDLLSNSLLLPL